MLLTATISERLFMGRFREIWNKFTDRSSNSIDESDFADGVSLDPTEILFSIASISDECPFDPLVSRANDTVPSINEDDWLQIEFFPISETRAVKNEFTKLLKHIELHRAGSGFSEIYLRQSLTQLPLINFAIDLRFYWKNRTPLAVGGYLAPHVFQAEFECGWRLYALEDTRNAILKLGIQPSARNASEEFLTTVQSCCAKQSLRLVDWQQIQVVDTSSVNTLRDWASLKSV